MPAVASKPQYLTAVAPPDLAESFRARALAEDRSVSSALKSAMRQYLAQNDEGRPYGGPVQESAKAARTDAA